MGCLKLDAYQNHEGHSFTGVWKKSVHSKSHVVYYPFGGEFNSYSRENSVPNKYKFNGGSELVDDLGLQIYHTDFREYDPWGRLGWWQIDPRVDDMYDWSPYNYSFDNPIRYNDPKGDCPPDSPCPEEEMTDVIAATVSDGLVGLYNLTIGPLTHQEASNDADGISIQIGPRQDPKTVGEAFLKTAGNGLKAMSVVPAPTQTLGVLAKTGVGAGVKTTLGKTLVEQGADLAKANKGNRVTMRSEKIKVEADVAGKSHINKDTKAVVPTPHVKISPRNFKAPKQPAYNTKGIEPVPMTQAQIRMAKKYIESLKK